MSGLTGSGFLVVLVVLGLFVNGLLGTNWRVVVLGGKVVVGLGVVLVVCGFVSGTSVELSSLKQHHTL